MASTYTGLKLQGLIGHFGKTAATDIEGFVELPDGKVDALLLLQVGFVLNACACDPSSPPQVVSGSDWGNLLLWEGNSIKVEICRKGGQTCHTGLVQPFALEDGQLMTIGSDGAVRVRHHDMSSKLFTHRTQKRKLLRCKCIFIALLLDVDLLGLINLDQR